MAQCGAQIDVVVYNGEDNNFSISLEERDGTPMTSFAGVTRVTITIDGTLIDSDVVGSSVIWWTDTETINGETVALIKFALGGQSLAVGTYRNSVVRVYDATYTGGLRIADQFKVTVV